MNKVIKIFLMVIALFVITDSYAGVDDGLDKIMNPSEPVAQKPKVKPKPRPPRPVQTKPDRAVADKNRQGMELENERLKKELETVKNQNETGGEESKDKNCAECPEMVSIPSLGISIGKYEVTQGQWKAMMGTNPSYFTACGDDCPVEQVSWNDIQAFIVKLNQRTGKQYRLPSEKEWEAACRAGGQHEYCGSDTVDEVAWYDENSGKSTHPVGKKKPNAFGLYDMSGNVWEWVQDCYDGDCTSRVLRGGSWISHARNTRSANRDFSTPVDSYYSFGFRFALGQTAK